MYGLIRMAFCTLASLLLCGCPPPQLTFPGSRPYSDIGGPWQPADKPVSNGAYAIFGVNNKTFVAQIFKVSSSQKVERLLIRSEDAGTTWQIRATPYRLFAAGSSTGRTLASTDPQNGMAVSRDAGATWTPIQLPAKACFDNEAFFPTAISDRGFVVIVGPENHDCSRLTGYRQRVWYRSVDFGSRWEELKLPASISLASSKDGAQIVVFESGSDTLSKSVDGCQTFSSIKVDIPIRRAYAFENGEVMLVGGSNTNSPEDRPVRVLDQNGKEIERFILASTPRSPFFLQSQLAFAIDGEQLMRSTDRGKSWKNVTTSDRIPVMGDERFGMIISTKQSKYTTTGGATWTDMATPIWAH